MPSDATSAPAKKRSVAQIEADLAKTREELTATVHELADKVNPKAQAALAVERAKSVGVAPLAIAAAAVAVGVAGFIIVRRMRS